MQVLQGRYGRLEIYDRMPFVLRFNMALFVIFSVVFLQAQGDAAFIYFDF